MSSTLVEATIIPDATALAVNKRVLDEPAKEQPSKVAKTDTIVFVAESETKLGLAGLPPVTGCEAVHDQDLIRMTRAHLNANEVVLFFHYTELAAFAAHFSEVLIGSCDIPSTTRRIIAAVCLSPKKKDRLVIRMNEACEGLLHFKMLSGLCMSDVNCPSLAVQVDEIRETGIIRVYQTKVRTLTLKSSEGMLLTDVTVEGSDGLTIRTLARPDDKRFTGCIHLSKVKCVSGTLNILDSTKRGFDIILADMDLYPLTSVATYTGSISLVKVRSPSLKKISLYCGGEMVQVRDSLVDHLGIEAAGTETSVALIDSDIARFCMEGLAEKLYISGDTVVGAYNLSVPQCVILASKKAMVQSITREKDVYLDIHVCNVSAEIQARFKI